MSSEPYPLPTPELTAPVEKAVVPRSASFIESVGFAWEGLSWLVQTQRNFRIHVLMAVLALSLCYGFHVLAWQWVTITLLIGVVFFAEAMNTVVEMTLDKVCQGQYDEEVKIIKDVAAAAVLIVAFLSLMVGVMIFVPYLVPMIQGWVG